MNCMLYSVLKSRKAIELNIKIIRAFISMREFLAKNKDVFGCLDILEKVLLIKYKNLYLSKLMCYYYE